MVREPARPAPPAVPGVSATVPAPATAAGRSESSRRPTAAVRFFGGFELSVDGTPVDLGPLRPRARALLRLLALTPDRDVHREYLVDSLWPGVDLTLGNPPTSGRGFQCAATSGARRAIRPRSPGQAGRRLPARHSRRAAPSTSDGSNKDCATPRPPRRRVTQSPAWPPGRRPCRCTSGTCCRRTGQPTTWSAERERLRLAAATAAASLAQDSRALGHPRQALAAARLSVQLDRYQDLAWDLLVELHEEAGDSSAAALARREHAQVQAELDVAAP